MTSSRVALSLLAALALASACGGKSAAPAPADTSTLEATATSVATATSTPRPTGTPLVLPTPRPIAEANEAVWRAIAVDTEANLRPLLRPPLLPDGLVTVLDNRSPNKPTPGLFNVEYRRPRKRLVIAAGPLNPPPPPITGHQERVPVRGNEAILNVEDDADPLSPRWMWWDEPGTWKPERTEAARPRVLYYVRVEGMTTEELLMIVEALQPWTPD